MPDLHFALFQNISTTAYSLRIFTLRNLYEKMVKICCVFLRQYGGSGKYEFLVDDM